MHIRSLHTRVNITLFILTITSILQLFSARNNLSILIDNQSILTQSHSNVGVVYGLERDVIDLQRSLLIFKETGSSSAIHRFHTIMENVNTQINSLAESVGEGNNHLVSEDMFSRMVAHLEDYESNFTSVISAKAKQVTSIERIDVALDKLNQYTINKNTKIALSIRGNIITLNQTMSDYLSTLNSDDIAIFNEYINNLKSNFKSINKTREIKEVNKVKKEFRRLIQLTRGYLYLVNVVMAGSANEFLFLTKKIREQATEKQNEIESLVNESSDYAEIINSIVSSISILIIFSIAWFLWRKILHPIRGMTNVFTSLAKGDDIGDIPNINRRDEIGDLARAAEVFHKNNLLTKDLLVESQDMIANQAVLNIQLENEKQKAEAAAKSKSTFLANMSHEIRTPMNGIVGLVDLMLKTHLTNKQERYLQRIAYSGQIMMNVINDILDFSKIEAGKMEIEAIEFDVNHIIENVISSMSVRIIEKNIDFKVWVTPNVPEKLIGDPLRISQILLNLCSNSIKFTEQGSIAIKFDLVDNMFCFSVHDTGIGMNKEQLDTIFESFTQADGSISRKYGGTGLGLSIVDQLVRMMKGNINVESNVGVGTDIYIKIKCSIIDDVPLLKPFNKNLPTVHYIGRNGKASAIKYVLQGLNINIEDLSTHDHRSDSLCAIPEHHYVLFEGMEALDNITMARCIDSQANMLCILNSDESNSKEKLQELGNIKILQHPFSPKQYQYVFKKLFNIEGDEAENHTQEKENVSITLTGHVLLVEDNQINQLVAGDMLESLGVTYDLAEDGMQAVEAVMNNTYDLVFMDVQMPKMDGYTATKTLREAGMNDVIICGLSANALKEDLEKATQSGMNDYLTKPLVQDSLQIMLEKYLT